MICAYCQQPTDSADTCTVRQVVLAGAGAILAGAIDGAAVNRIRYPADEYDHPCHDCNVLPGGLHHPGCDMETCPFCGGQAFICDCELRPPDMPAASAEESP